MQLRTYKTAVDMFGKNKRQNCDEKDQFLIKLNLGSEIKRQISEPSKYLITYIFV